MSVSSSAFWHWFWHEKWLNPHFSGLSCNCFFDMILSWCRLGSLLVFLLDHYMFRLIQSGGGHYICTWWNCWNQTSLLLDLITEDFSNLLWTYWNECWLWEVFTFPWMETSWGHQENIWSYYSFSCHHILIPNEASLQILIPHYELLQTSGDVLHGYMVWFHTSTQRCIFVHALLQFEIHVPCSLLQPNLKVLQC